MADATTLSLQKVCSFFRRYQLWPLQCVRVVSPIQFIVQVNTQVLIRVHSLIVHCLDAHQRGGSRLASAEVHHHLLGLPRDDNTSPLSPAEVFVYILQVILLLQYSTMISHMVCYRENLVCQIGCFVEQAPNIVQLALVQALTCGPLLLVSPQFSVSSLSIKTRSTDPFIKEKTFNKETLCSIIFF